jgi:MFS-type transporter involved in bile tolerance (Atg22 family)
MMTRDVDIVKSHTLPSLAVPWLRHYNTLHFRSTLTSHVGVARSFVMTVGEEESSPAVEASIQGVQEQDPASVEEGVRDDEGVQEPRSAPIFQRKLSASEEATLNSSGRFKSPWWLSWIEVIFVVPAPSTGQKLPEATGWSIDAAARAPTNQAGAFVGTALLRLATNAAGCTRPFTCTNTLSGLKPSSLLSAASAVTGVVGAIFMPVFGAVVDHTRHRKVVGVISAFLVCAITGAQMSISQDSWLAILILEAVGAFSLLVHVTAVFAYLPDLTFNESDLSHYTSRFNLRQYGLQTVYVGILAIIGVIRGDDNSLDASVRAARTALGLAFGFAVPLFTYAWTFLFRKREALSEVPEGSNLITAGFVQVGTTFAKLWSRYHALRWFMISLLWSPEAGSGVVLSIAVTFLTIFLEMNSQQVAYTSLILLAANLPGSYITNWVCQFFNPLFAYRAGLVFFSASVATASVFLTGPERRDWAYFFAFLWGIGYGLMYPAQRVLFCTLTPRKQETELMGLFVFAGQILGWLPPVVFTILNERNVDMRWSLSIIAFFTFFAFLCTLPMGSYGSAVEQVAEEQDISKESTVICTAPEPTCESGSDAIHSVAEEQR